MKIKTKVSDPLLTEYVHLAASTVSAEGWDRSISDDVVPRDHLVQIMHQCAVLSVNTALYASASETGLLYADVINFGRCDILVTHRAEIDAVGTCLMWAHLPGL